MKQFGGNRDDWTVLPTKTYGLAQCNAFSPPDYLDSTHISPLLPESISSKTQFVLEEYINPQNPIRYEIKVSTLNISNGQLLFTIPVTELNFESVKSAFNNSPFTFFFSMGDTSLISDEVIKDMSAYLNALWDDFSLSGIKLQLPTLVI